MSAIKISELTEQTIISALDYLPFLDSSDTAQGTAGSTRKIKLKDLFNLPNPTAKSGLGLLLKNQNTFTIANEGALSLIELDFHNTQTTPGLSVISGIQIITDSDLVDTAAGIRIVNNGQSDGLYINVAGKAGAVLSTPTGIGMDINRSGGGENASNNKGYGIQIWDWSQTDTGIDTPTALYLSKHINSDTHHNLLKIEGNRNLLRFKVPQAGLYTGVEPLIDILGGGALAQRFIITAHGDLAVGPNVPTLEIESWNRIGALSNTTNQVIYFDVQTGVGRLTSIKTDFVTGRDLVIVTKNNLGESIRIDSKGNLSIGTAQLGTSVTDGFLYIPTCNGIPTGVPTSKTGLVPMIYDSANNNFYFYNSGWKKTTAFS